MWICLSHDKPPSGAGLSSVAQDWLQHIGALHMESSRDLCEPEKSFHRMA
jgi:hypothetical protein